MKILNFFILFVIQTTTFANLMYFDVARGEMNKVNPKSDVLSGDLEARDVQIEFSTERFEIENPTSQGLDAEVEWNDKTSLFSIKKEGMKFSTAIAQGLGISGLEEVKLREAKIRLDKKGISLDGDFFAFSHSNFRCSFEKANIFCPTKKFEPEIDKACLNISQSEIGVIKYQQNVFDADFIRARAIFNETQLSLMADVARFNDKAETTVVDNFKLICSKLPKGQTLAVDTFSLLAGCLYKSDISIDSMNTTEVERTLMKVALDEADPKFSKEENKDLIDLDYTKDVKLTLRKGELSFESVVKAIFWVKVRLKARVDLDTKKRELLFKIQDARVLGIPVRKLAYRLIEKFGRVDYIELRGDLVVFKL